MKKGGKKLSPLEKSVAMELENLQQNNEDLKSELKDLRRQYRFLMQVVVEAKKPQASLAHFAAPS